MDRLAEIKATFVWFAAHHADRAAALAAANDLAGLERLDVKRDVLERGIFALMFAQFERRVNETFEEARDDRAANPDWQRRRGWDAAALAGPRVPFETRLAMVMDKRSDAYAEVLTSYATRNHCAHGGTSAPVGSIDDFEARLYLWQGELRS